MFELTKEVKLNKTNHNSLTCYKDETKLYMVTKDEKNKWHLYRAKEHNDDLINELRCWGYEELHPNWTYSTLAWVKTQIEDDIIWGAWFDRYQQELKCNYYET